MEHPLPDFPRTWRERFTQFIAPRVRTWAVTVPLHVLAFIALYVATARIMETEITQLASEAAGDRLELVSRELNELALAHRGTPDVGHLFRALVAEHREINLQLFRRDGSFIGSQVPPSESDHGRMNDFSRGDRTLQVWLDSGAGSDWLRGFRRIHALTECAPCHEPGQTLAVAVMSSDLTTIMTRVRSRSRRNLAILIVTWAALLGGINIVVQRSIRRSGEHLRERLAAVEAGEESATVRGGELVLDPASAWLYGALGDFLDRQRKRQYELASRLEHADQLASLGRLAAGLAHEIKNPLAGIQGAIEILSEDNLDERTGMLYTDMLAELKRVDTTLQTLLESARPAPPRLADTRPESLLKETVYLLRGGLSRRNVSLRYEIAPGTCNARIDAAKIRQVLINLIQNAAEAVEAGGHIVVRAGNFPEVGAGLILAVEDDGPGISADVQGKVFEPFFTTKFSGTGLGLAISKRLVEQHGGSLQVDSVQGKGTTFYIFLPSRVDDMPSGENHEVGEESDGSDPAG